MQGNRTNVESSDKYRHILIIRGMHAAALIPGRQKGSASHGRYNLSVLLVHTCDITLAGQAEPVRIHCFCRAFHSGIEHILQRLAGTMQIFVIQKHNLREKNRLFAVFLALTFFSHIQHLNGCKLCKTARSDTGSHGDKRIISTAGCNRIKFVFPSLEALFKISCHVSQSNFFRLLLRNSETGILIHILLIRLFRIRL